MCASPVTSEGLIHGDCIDGMRRLEDASVAMVFADLPYGRTQNEWDRLVPIEPLWYELNRVCRLDAAMIFTSMQPFTSLLVCSNPKAFRYEIIWQKNKVRGFLNAKKQPLRTHENVLVFYRAQPGYQPQMMTGHAPVHSYTKHTSDGTNYGATRRGVRGGGSTERYPTSILPVAVVNNDDPIRVQPTQKPEALVAWFLRTYTHPGDLVLDPTAGSGTTLVAAKRLGRRFVGFEMDGGMVARARTRLDEMLPETH
jgi:DNA modification methylase